MTDTSEILKTDLVNKVVIGMWDDIGEQKAKKLQGVLYTALLDVVHCFIFVINGQAG